MNGLDRLMELLNASGEVDYLDPIGERHVVAALHDGTRLLVAAEGVTR